MDTNIYFIKRGNEVKIGRSIDVERRIEELQVANSVDLRLLYKIENVPEDFELHVHSVCARFHVRGEWFDEGVIEHLLSHPFYSKVMVKIYSTKSTSFGSA